MRRELGSRKQAWRMQVWPYPYGLWIQLLLNAWIMSQPCSTSCWSCMSLGIWGRKIVWTHVIKIGLTHMHMEHFLERRFFAFTHLSVREVLGWAWSLVRGMQKAQSQRKCPLPANPHESAPKALKESDWGLISRQSDIFPWLWSWKQLSSLEISKTTAVGCGHPPQRPRTRSIKLENGYPQHQQTDTPLFFFSALM